MLPYRNLSSDNMELEIWLPVVGYDKYYDVSNMGRIRSKDRVFTFGKKNAQKVMYFSKIIEQYLNKKGYLVVGLHGDNKSKTLRVHQLVAQSFIENAEYKPTVDHINGVKDDNRVENLRWATWKEQGETTKKNGLYKPRKGKDHHQSKVVYQYCTSGELLGVFDCLSDASKKSGISPSHIGKNCQGKYEFVGGFVFSYSEKQKEYFNRDFKKRTRKIDPIIKYDLSMNEIRRYDSPRFAADDIGGKHSNIHYAAIGKFPTSYGFKWRYAKDV